MIDQKKVVSFSYDAGRKLLIATWTVDFQTSVTMDDIKQGFKDYLEFTQDRDLRAVIMDFSQVRYPITDDLYGWAIENLVQPTHARGVRLFAYVSPEDPISRFGFDMYIQDLIMKLKENNQDVTAIRRNIFQTLQQAQRWINDRLALLSDN